MYMYLLVWGSSSLYCMISTLYILFTSEKCLKKIIAKIISVSSDVIYLLTAPKDSKTRKKFSLLSSLLRKCLVLSPLDFSNNGCGTVLWLSAENVVGSNLACDSWVSMGSY